MDELRETEKELRATNKLRLEQVEFYKTENQRRQTELREKDSKVSVLQK